MTNPFKKEESTAAHNVRQLLGCAPVLGSLAVGILGLVAFGIGVNHLGDRQPGWLIGGSVGLVGSGIGFGVLAWLVWADRRDEVPGPQDRGDRVTPASPTSK